MPRYDYQCTSCDNQFELVQSFKEAGSGSPALCVPAKDRRVFHAVPVIYKGSGFYTTDYGRPKSPPSETKEKESSGDSESKSSGSSDGSSSSETKSESTPAAAETTA